jgi:hypothetical protein
MAMDEKWQDEVFEKLVEVFKSNEEDLARILFFLDEEDKSYKDNVDRPYAPHWKRLKDTVRLDEAFRMYAKRLSDETRRAEKDQEYRKRLAQFYEETLSYDESAVPIEVNQKLDSSQLLRRGSTSTSAFGGLAKAWEIITAEDKESLANYIKTTTGNRNMMTAVDDVVRQISNKASGTVVMVGLAAVYLTVTAVKNIKRWWSGEITGKRCIKNVLDSSISVGAGMAGGYYGALAGSFIAGPAGTFVGGVVGGWVSAASASYLSDWMTQKMFGLPKEEALENAYRYLGVDMTASNAKVNTAFRKLCLQHHPDKGGNPDNFFILQCNMGIIRLARGEP